MFAKLERDLSSFRIEMVTADTLFRGQLNPLGDLIPFLNDRRRQFVSLVEAEIVPLYTDRKTAGIRRESISVSKEAAAFISFLSAEEVEQVKVITTTRPVAMYASSFVLQGDLHVNADVHSDDLLDETKDYYALSAARLFPLRSLAAVPAARVPFVCINRRMVIAYHQVSA